MPESRRFDAVGVLPGTMLYAVFQHARTLWDFKAQYNLNRTTSLFFDIYNLTNDWTNNDYVHAFGRDAQFAKFYRSLEAYRATFRSKSDVMVLDPSSDFFKAMRGAGSAGK